MKLVVISAGLRVPSSTALLADQLTEAVRERAQVEVVRIELRELAHQIADALLTGFATGALRDAQRDLVAADAVIVVTPTFSASYSGLFKSFFDVLDPEVLVDKPVLMAATGGTERHSLVLDHALRPLFSYLKAEVLNTALNAATSDFGGAGAGALHARINRAAAELVARVEGAAPRVAEQLPVTPFEELLRG